MGRFLVHHDGLFLEWSTVVDAPVTYGMTPEETRAYVLQRYGDEGAATVDSRMARAVERGTSCISPPYTFADVVAGNRAGPDETELSKADLIRTYFERKDEQEPPNVR